MSTTSTGSRVLAQGEYRVEGREKVSGRAQYAADFTLPGMLWAAFVTSPYPHARVIEVDTSAARRMPGVHTILTGTDLAGRYFGRRLQDWPVLAHEVVRFVGDYVAAVAADSPEHAETAAGAVAVTYAELPAVFDPQSALAPGALILHPEPERYGFIGTIKRNPVPHLNVQGYERGGQGDLAAGFAQAERIIEGTYTTPRMFAGYIEPRATLVWIDEKDVTHVISTSKAPFLLREQFALSTGLPKEKFVIEPCFIGGDFGAKGHSVEEFHCYYLARASGRPVKHVRRYADDMQGTCIRHASRTTVRAGVAGGRIVALHLDVVFDGGAYAAAKPVPRLIPGRTPKTPYYIPNVLVERKTVYTNTVPGGFMRGPGDVQILFALESHMDVVARDLGVDPIEFRKRHALHPDQSDIDGRLHRDYTAPAVLDALARHVTWGPATPGRGAGIALTARHIGGGATGLDLTLQPDGSLEVHTGIPEVGVGVLTMVQRVVASVLDIDPARVRPRRGNTGEVPFDPGVSGSRSTHLVGGAAIAAATDLRARLEARSYPVTSWEVASAQLTAAGPITIRGTYARDEDDPAGDWTGIALYYVDLSVDPDTGDLTFHDILLITDAGTIINPVAYRGQIDGGFIFGFAHALLEELRVDDGKVVNPNLGEYKLPTQRDTPPFRYVTVPAHGPGPFGAKTAGELHVSGVAPAIANAIAAACGVRLVDLPLHPERIYEALRARVGKEE